jgi:hypothetical protein
MSDHAIGLIGVALAIISVVAPFRWPTMHRLWTDLGLGAGAILIGIAIAPYVGEKAMPPAIPWAQSAPIVSASSNSVKSNQTKSPDQKTTDGLMTQLAAAKSELAATKEELEKTKDLIAISSIAGAWGFNGPNFMWMKANAGQVMKYKGVIKLLLIVRAEYSNVDRMTDQAIAKSKEYSLVDGIITLSSNDFAKLFIASNPVTLEFNLVGLPLSAASESIDSLAAIDKVNGHIIATKTMLLSAPTK